MTAAGVIVARALSAIAREVSIAAATPAYPYSVMCFCTAAASTFTSSYASAQLTPFDA